MLLRFRLLLADRTNGVTVPLMLVLCPSVVCKWLNGASYRKSVWISK